MAKRKFDLALEALDKYEGNVKFAKTHVALAGTRISSRTWSLAINAYNARGEEKPQNNPDVRVRNRGSIYLVELLSDTATQWVTDNVSDPIWFGRALAVEHRYIRDLVASMQNDGLEVN